MIRLPRFRFFVPLFLLGGALPFSCQVEEGRTDRFLPAGEQIALKYASHFSVYEEPYGYRVVLFIGEKTQGDSITYTFSREESSYVSDGSVWVHIPVSRIGTNSGTLFEFLRLLGVSDKLVATCDTKYIFSDEIRERISSGEIIPLGSSFDINGENVLIAHPDILVLSDLRDDPHSNVCPIVHNLEWKESSLLSRTEWIKFFALLFDEFGKGDSIFSDIERRYLELRRMTDTLSERPTVFSAGNYGDTWYLTGGKGYMSQLYEDAGGRYLLSDTLVPTVTCGTEWLLEHFSEADYWMNCGTDRIRDLDARLYGMKSVRNREVFHFGKRKRKVEGVNITDFYESAVARPDVVLADVISVLHPEMLPNHKTVYLGRCVDE